MSVSVRFIIMNSGLGDLMATTGGNRAVIIDFSVEKKIAYHHDYLNKFKF